MISVNYWMVDLVWSSGSYWHNLFEILCWTLLFWEYEYVKRQSQVWSNLLEESWPFPVFSVTGACRCVVVVDD